MPSLCRSSSCQIGMFGHPLLTLLPRNICLTFEFLFRQRFAKGFSLSPNFRSFVREIFNNTGKVTACIFSFIHLCARPLLTLLLVNEITLHRSQFLYKLSDTLLLTHRISVGIVLSGQPRYQTADTSLQLVSSRCKTKSKLNS